jgi:gamma-glutamyl hercynylcysteine S-oxide synthase
MIMPVQTLPSADVLASWVRDARQRCLELVADLDDTQLLGPQLAIVNPPLWEIGHGAWFQEKWVLRHAAGRPPLSPDADALYDSAAVAHATRWDLRLPSRKQTLQYMARVEDAVLERLTKPLRPEDVYFTLLTIFHEDMHTEAFTYTRQTHGYPAPGRRGTLQLGNDAGSWRSDVMLDGGSFMLGATADEPFVFDNEKWAHPVELRPFAIARAPVTQAEFAAFVDDGGYGQRGWWDDAGWTWREREGAQQPVYWRRDAGSWLRRDFDCWVPLEPHRPVIHVNCYEAEAYCRWAGRRLPTEAEWEAAASWPGKGTPKRRFPWGDVAPGPEHANLDGQAVGCVDVAARAPGDSACGCRQMVGNVWEWTADGFRPYPGFVPDPYKEYSAPWFGDHRVLRGGCWATRGRLLRNTWRNFYRPERRDVFAGFRTCAP